MQFHGNQLRKYVLTNHLVMTYIPQNEFHGETHKKKKKKEIIKTTSYFGKSTGVGIRKAGFG